MSCVAERSYVQRPRRDIERKRLRREALAVSEDEFSEEVDWIESR